LFKNRHFSAEKDAKSLKKESNGKKIARENFLGLVESGSLIPVSPILREATSFKFARSSKLEQMTMDTEQESLDYLCKFHALCYRLELPTNNPIAFFHSLTCKTSSILENSVMKESACELLKMVYADRKFLFGSSFDSESDEKGLIRTSDLYNFMQEFENADKSDKNYEDLIENTLSMQSRLNSAVHFCANYRLILEEFKKLEDLKEQYRRWNLMKKEPVDRPFHLTKNKAVTFFKIYRRFSAMQYKKITAKTKAELDELEEILKTSFVIFRFCSNIQRIKKNKHLHKYLNALSEIIKNYFLINQPKLNHLVLKVKEKSKGFEDLEVTINIFRTACKNSKQKEDYPWLFGNDNTIQLSLAEEDLFDTLESIPFVKCLTQIQFELNMPNVQLISSFYLFEIFNHAKNILSPFFKKTYECDSSKYGLECKIMSTDSSAVLNQKSSVYLYNALQELCYKNFQDILHYSLCDFLFERCRGYAPHKHYIFKDDRFTKVEEGKLPQYRLQYMIDMNLTENLDCDLMCFQQYSVIPCTAKDFYEFFYDKKNEVLKHLKKILKPDKIQEYCEIALFTAEGYGTSHQSVVWHKRIADFMDDIIDHDTILCEYVDGDSVSYDDIPLSHNLTLTDAIDNIEPVDNSIFYKGWYLSAHARIQLAIHAICLAHAAEAARMNALSAYKKFFF